MGQPVKIMINGLPGNMAAIVYAHAVGDDRFDVIPYSLTGPEITDTEWTAAGNTISLILPENRAAAMERIKREFEDFISIDFTHPSAVNGNAEFYCANRLPFVMGTTGGDRKKLDATVRESDTSAVIAPNMAKQIVGFQAMMSYAADTFPDIFSGYSLRIRESHQQGKADTSGTAKAIVNYFNDLGLPFSKEDIEKERNPDTQLNQWGVPEQYLDGHGWHTYTLLSGDQTVRFEFTHNVNGRDVYAMGTLDAVLFLQAKSEKGETGRAYSMIDVLKGA